METNTETKILEPETVQPVQESEVSPPTTPAEDKPRSAHIEVAQDREGKWAWCLWASNGRPLCVSHKSYDRRSECTNNLETVKETFQTRGLKTSVTL